MLSRPRRRPYVRHWWLLASVFAFLSMDEVAMVHDTLSGVISARVDTGGVLRYVWVVPYGIGVAALGGFYLPFFLRLPPRSRWLFVLAAGLYVGGALGFEMVSGYWESYHGGGAISLSMTICGETAEMLGSATFGYALCDYLRNEFVPGQ